MRYLILILIGALFSLSAFSQIGRKTNTVIYAHSSVGTTAQDAISAGSVDSKTWGWSICHDSESTATYLAIGVAADPLTDGMRVGPGECFKCENCGAKSLTNANVKAQAAATGYSVIQFKN